MILGELLIGLELPYPSLLYLLDFRDNILELKLKSYCNLNELYIWHSINQVLSLHIFEVFNYSVDRSVLLRKAVA